MEGARRHVLQTYRNQFDRAQIQLMLITDNLQEIQVPITSGFYPLQASDAATVELLTMLERVLTSRQTINLEEGLKLHIRVLNAPARNDNDASLFGRSRLPPLRGESWETALAVARKNIDCGRNIFPLPSFSGHPILNNCCFLPALVIGLIIQEELTKATSWTNLKTSPQTLAWKEIYLWKWNKNEKSVKVIENRILTFVQTHNIDLEVIRRGNLHEICRTQLNSVKVNLNFYLSSAEERRIFHYPTVYRPEFPTVDILVKDGRQADDINPPSLQPFIQEFPQSLEPAQPLQQQQLPKEEQGVTWPVKKRHTFRHVPREFILPKRSCSFTSSTISWHAASVVINPRSFFHRHQGSRCVWCGKLFSTLLFMRAHHCRLLPSNRKKCVACYRVKARRADYITLTEKEDRCCHEIQKETADEVICQTCQAVCYGKDCLIHHKRMCVKRSWLSCPKCFKKITKRKPHVCGKRYCEPCEEHYPEHLAHHDCIISPAKPLVHVDGFAVWDTETVFSNKEGRHRVNAVGLAFEDGKRGHFSEIYFYSDVMRHPEDSQLKKHTLIFNYCGENQEVPKMPNEEEEEEEEKGANEDLDYKQQKKRKAKKRKKLSRKLKKAVACITAKKARMENLAARQQEKEEEEEEKDESALAKFIDFILCEDFENFTFIAHYGQAFDMILLLRHFLNRNVRCQPMFQGNKCMLLELPQFAIRFIDSHRYITGALDTFTKRFPSIPSHLSKGCFPYKFNQPQFYEYRGKVPPLSMFVDDFSPSKKVQSAKTFIEEYKGEYNFKKELHHYLVKDIQLLAWGVCCLTKEFNDFQELLQENGQSRQFFFCFSKPFLTVPQFIHSLWRTFGLRHRLYLLSNQTLARKASTLEMEWLAWEQKCLTEKEGPHRNIRTAFSHPEGQHRVGKYSCDGYDHPFVYEFLGCAVHCHYAVTSECTLTGDFNKNHPNPFKERPNVVLERFEKKSKYLIEKGLHLKIMWECEWVQLKQRSPQVRAFLEKWKEESMLPPYRLKIRDALRGGRCEAFRLLYDQRKQPRHRLLYIDKNSLYPYVAMKFQFPVGKPQVLLGEELEQKLSLDSEKGFLLDGEPCQGLLQATVNPPESLFLPALPVMCDNKLMFGLCMKCMKDKVRSFCTHSDRERVLTDTWTCHELAYALNHCGYTLVKAHEGLLYKERAEIFRDFYSLLAKMKITSEKPQAQTEEELEEYLASINRVMPWLNIKKEDLAHNEALRAFAKLLSNSALGKLSQNELKKHVVYVHSWEELYNLLKNPRIKLSSVNPIHDFLAEVTYEEQDFMMGLQRNTHCIVYSHVTAFARTEMLDDMRRLQKEGFNLFYTDTDSIIFSMPEEKYDSFSRSFELNNPAYGLYKEETKGRIMHFSSLGCKNYSFITNKGEECVKVRGFTLSNAQALETLNPNSMTSMVEHFLKDEHLKIKTEQSKLQLDRRQCSIHNVVQKKLYSNYTFDKRYVPDKNDVNATSIPYGCRHDQFMDK
jgi:DNA polymerase elongation subunit (family B)